MRSFNHVDQRGFTLIELMVVVAIIGCLAALAIGSITRYLKVSRTAEAKNGVGRIARCAAESYARETIVQELVGPGQFSAITYHQLCDDAVPVPSTIPPAQRYQPKNHNGMDFTQGTSSQGWQCLRFEVLDAIYYQYDYQRDSNTYCTTYGCQAAAQTPNFEAAAIGDLDGDGTYSAFVLNGEVDGTTHELIRATAVHIANEYE